MSYLWPADHLLYAVRGTTLHEQSWQATSLALDVASVRSGSVFIADDAADHETTCVAVRDAFAKGAVAAIVTRKPSNISPSFPLVYVDSCAEALRALARTARARSKATCIAVAGSVGTTSCATFLRTLLESIGATHTLPLNPRLDTHANATLTLAHLPTTARWSVIDLGMGCTDPALGEILKPNLYVIADTTASGIDSVARLFDSMTAADSVVLNRDDPAFAQLTTAARARGLRKILSFGRNTKADARLVSCVSSPTGCGLTLRLHGETLQTTLPAPAPQTHFGPLDTYASNGLAFYATGALLAAMVAGADPVVGADALTQTRLAYPAGHRQTVALDETQAFTLVDETLNASPFGLNAALARLTEIRTPQGRRILVLGDGCATGLEAAGFMKNWVSELQKAKIDLVYCCGERSLPLYTALSGAMRGAWAATSDDLAFLLPSVIAAGDCVMIKGAEAHPMHRIVEALASAGSAPAIQEAPSVAQLSRQRTLLGLRALASLKALSEPENETAALVHPPLAV